VKILARTSSEVAPKTIPPSDLQMRSRSSSLEKPKNKKRKKRRKLLSTSRSGTKKLPLPECLLRESRMVTSKPNQMRESMFTTLIHTSAVILVPLCK
jgi:hypothetical protein